MKRMILTSALALMMAMPALQATAMRVENPMTQDDNNGGAPQQRQRMDPTKMIERRVNNMVKKYGLTTEQATALKSLFTEQMNSRKGTKDEQAQRPSREDMKTQREAFEKKLKAILTEEQYAAYQKDEAAMRQQRQQRMQQRQDQDGGGMQQGGGAPDGGGE